MKMPLQASRKAARLTLSATRLSLTFAPTAIPDSLDADLTGLDIGDNVKISEHHTSRTVQSRPLPIVISPSHRLLAVVLLPMLKKVKRMMHQRQMKSKPPSKVEMTTALPKSDQIANQFGGGVASWPPRHY